MELRLPSTIDNVDPFGFQDLLVAPRPVDEAAELLFDFG